jgi:hypothetical protein
VTALVTQKNDASKTVTKIETLDKNADFEMRDKGLRFTAAGVHVD